MKLNLKGICFSASFFASLCCLVALIQFQSLQKLKMNTDSSKSCSLSAAELLALKKMPSVGFRNIVANWTFVQFLQYFGDDDVRKQTGYGDSANYLSATIRHDPYYREFYVFLSGSTTIFAGKPEETVAVMSEGLAQLSTRRASDSYYIWRYKGTDELLFLNDGQSAQKSFEMAAKWAAQSDDVDGSIMSQISEQTAQFLADNPDSKLAQINAWGSVLTTALDDGTRKRAISKIRELGGDVLVTNDGQIQIEYSKVEGSSDS